MFKMGCSMAKKILAIDGKQAPDQQGSSSSSSSSKLSKQTDKHQEFASAGTAAAAAAGGGGGGGGGGGKRGTGDELGDFSKLEEDPRIPLNVRQIFKITKSWKAIARTMSKTGTAMFLNLFEQNQDLLNLFQRFQHLKGRELHESTELREHAAQVMSILDQSINSLSDYDNFVTYLHSIGKSHRKVPGFKRAHFWKIEQPFLKAVKQTLDERCNETIEGIYKIAIKLIIETIADGYGQDEEDSATDSLAKQPGGGGGNGSGNSGGSATDGKEGDEQRGRNFSAKTEEKKEKHNTTTSTKPPTNGATTRNCTSDIGQSWLRAENFFGDFNERLILDQHKYGNHDNNNNNNNNNECENLTAINGRNYSQKTPLPTSCKYGSTLSSTEKDGELDVKIDGKELKETLFVLRELLTLLVSRRDPTKTQQQAISTSPQLHKQPPRRKPLIQKQINGLVKRQIEESKTAATTTTTTTQEAERGSGSLINRKGEFNVKACAPVDSRCVSLVSYRKIECKRIAETEVASSALDAKTGATTESKTENKRSIGIGNEGLADVGVEDFKRHNNNCCLARHQLNRPETYTRNEDESTKVCGVRLAMKKEENKLSSRIVEGDKDAGCLSEKDECILSRRLRGSDDSIYRANCELLFEDAKTKLEPVKMHRKRSNTVSCCRLETQVVKFPQLATTSQQQIRANADHSLTANKLQLLKATTKRNSNSNSNSDSKRPFHSIPVKEGKIDKNCRRSESSYFERTQVACEASNEKPFVLTSYPQQGISFPNSSNCNGGSQSKLESSCNQETHHDEKRTIQAVDKPSRGEFSHRKSLKERSCSSVCSLQIKQSSLCSSPSSSSSSSSAFEQRQMDSEFEGTLAVCASKIGSNEREKEGKSNEKKADNNTGHYIDDRNSMKFNEKKREKTLQLSTDPGDLRELIKMLMLTTQANSRNLLAPQILANKNNHTICAPHHITTSLHQTSITLTSSSS